MTSDQAKRLPMFLFAGELSTQNNLRHLHPELVNQIVEQVWPAAYEQGRADACNAFKIKMKELDPEISKMVDENFWDLLA